MKFSWGSTLVGGRSGACHLLEATRDPTFHLNGDATKVVLNFPVLDAEMILTVHVTNPNVIPIHYFETAMSIIYSGSLPGSAPWPPAGSSSEEVSRRVARREMVLDSILDISGAAKVMWWGHKFKVHVDSHVIVDPVYLDVIDQENQSKLELFVNS
ncbi:hypothetical protein CDL12_27016 [Handroanthus impetiginosus]|uniref:Water stress and hypersensitive response domain-containing protein n=1 Tax=Handroanthus impetiginosus TaxID=429701 RepID=A0A2G9G599_9LAMI|nr:hypothetical protein CDL12_27016 [Handroanthus impetiginosus]